MDPITDDLLARFLRYVAIPSQSDAAATTLPSSPGQMVLARLLETELRALGLADIVLDDRAILTARLPATAPGIARIGFCAHLDTVDVGLSPVIHPQRLRYTGSDLCLNQAADIWMRAAEHPEAARYAGEDLIVTDGTSVLGADNKSAIAIVMTLLATLVRDKPAHGDICIAFVPDEEIGLRGAKAMELERFPVDFAYTIDSCEIGEFVYESFHAAQAEVVVTGVTAHPMSAKGVLVNPLLVAAELVSRLDPLQTPEHTEGREGYIWANGLQAGQAEARVKISIRDFDTASFAARKQALRDAVAATQAAHPRAGIACEITDSYANIAASLGNDRRSIALLEQGFAAQGIAPNVLAMRGGTDGSALSARGVPTPNYFTGGLNFHSCFEFLPLSSFAASYRVTESLVRLAAQGAVAASPD